MFTVLIVAVLTLPSVAAAAQQAVPAAPDYSSLARDVVTALAARQFDTVFAQFNDTRSPSLSATRIGAGWDQVLAQSGQFRKIESVDVVDRRYHVATIACLFDNARRDIIIYLDDSGRIAGLHFAPATPSPEPSGTSWSVPPYADPSAIHEDSVTVADGQWRLPGTLTLPDGNGPFAAVVLVSGSGPSDADETVGPNKPFKDLAWGLASKGIAVLRYPKRTRQYGAASTLNPHTLTVKDEYLDDARAAVALLASRPDVNPRRIFLAGHSEGGYLAPRIAAGDPKIAGIIILEGSTRPIEQGALDQLRYLAALGGPNAAALEKEASEVEAQAAVIEAPGLKAGTDVRLLSATVPAS